MSSTVTFIVCPFCGLGRPIEKLGSRAILKKRFRGPKGNPRFDVADPETSPFIDFRTALGGRGGFPRESFLTLVEASKDPQYEDLVHQIVTQARKILRVLGEDSGEDIQS